MKLSLVLSLIFITLAYSKLTKKSAKNSDAQKRTVVTYTITQQQNQEKQVIKFSLKASQEDASLVAAIQQAKQLEQYLRDIFSQFCHTYSSQQYKDNCEQFVETGQYKINAEYYHLMGQQAFKTFVVKFQIEFTTTAVDFVGILIDEFSDLMQQNKVVIGKISWEDITDDIQQQKFIDEGVQRAHGACTKLGLKLHKIQSLQIYRGNELDQEEEQQKKKPKQKKEEEGDQEEQQQQQQQEQQQQNPEDEQQEQKKYKFVIICKSINPKQKKLSRKVVNLPQQRSQRKKGKLVVSQ